MKIGLVLPYNVALGGGVQEIVAACKEELKKRGHDVYVITPTPRDAEPKGDKDIIYIGKATDFNSPLHTTSQVSAVINEQIDAMLEQHQFDILHFHEPWVPMLSAQILSRSKCVNVATFHAKLPETLMTRTIIKVVTPYTKSVLKYIDEFTAVSPAAAEYVSSLTDKAVTLIPNGIDLNVYKAPVRRTDNKKQKTIFYVGRLEQRKGVKHLIHAFELLTQTDPDVSLIIGGDGPDRQKLEALVGDLRLNNVAFVGYISDKEKIHYLRTSDVYCSPALYGESFGIVLLEAMATGTVIVAGDNPGYASVMNGLGAISLVNPKHHAEFARRLGLLLRENDLRGLWRQWAAEQIPNYSYTHIVAQYEEIYKKAIREHAAKVAEAKE
jgi:phosphatidylinositol alpha-mannosyltransferase